VEFEECGVVNWSCFLPSVEALAVTRGSVSMDVVKAARARRVVVESARLEKVRVALCRHADGSLNFEFFAAKKRAGYVLEAEDWVEVSAVPESELRDDLSEAESEFVMTEEEEEEEEGGSPSRLWSLFREAAARAGEVEGRLRRRERRTMLEDAALAALDAAKTAKSSLDESTASAKQWARDKVRDGLREALGLAYDRADRTIADQKGGASPSSWRLEFAPAAFVAVDEFQLEMYGPDGRPLYSTMVFSTRRLTDLDASTSHLHAKPSRVLLKLCFVLVESCVQELVDRRPADAAGLAKVVAMHVAEKAGNKTKHLIQEKARAWLNDDDDDAASALTPNPASLSDLTIPIPDSDD